MGRCQTTKDHPLPFATQREQRVAVSAGQISGEKGKNLVIPELIAARRIFIR
jgi:hypothetical protein